MKSRIMVKKILNATQTMSNTPKHTTVRDECKHVRLKDLINYKKLQVRNGYQVCHMKGTNVGTDIET